MLHHHLHFNFEWSTKSCHAVYSEWASYKTLHLRKWKPYIETADTMAYLFKTSYMLISYMFITISMESGSLWRSQQQQCLSLAIKSQRFFSVQMKTKGPHNKKKAIWNFQYGDMVKIRFVVTKALETTHTTFQLCIVNRGQCCVFLWSHERHRIQCMVFWLHDRVWTLRFNLIFNMYFNWY